VSDSSQAPVRIPITRELDLHTFNPSEVEDLLPAYLAECCARHFPDVRIIHGKGTGRLRVRVHALLQKMPCVKSYRLGNEFSGSWGATIVTLRT
jgi:dsDNA-specific endonuclease/ATPase MutS2